MRRRYTIIDVFTDTKLAGNPLAVVVDGDGLDDRTMQAVAREFNLSETVFCVTPRDPVNSAAIRIFTPAAELPFAGHPTIGTAIVLGLLRAPDLVAREDVGLVLEEKIGCVACSVRHRRGEAAHAHFDVPMLPEPAGTAPPIAELAAVLGLEAADIGFGTHRPSRFSAGNPATFVPVATLEALARVRLRPSDERTIFYAYTPAERRGAPTYRARMLATGLGVSEDPATGSVAAAFPVVLLAHEMLADGTHDCVLLQGVEMGRPSRIGVAFAVAGGRVASVTIGGSAVIVAEGTLDL